MNSKISLALLFSFGIARIFAQTDTLTIEGTVDVTGDLVVQENLSVGPKTDGGVFKTKSLPVNLSGGKWYKIARIQSRNPIDSGEHSQFVGTALIQTDYGQSASHQYIANFSFGSRGPLKPLLTEFGNAALRDENNDASSRVEWAVYQDLDGWRYLYFHQSDWSRLSTFTYAAHEITEYWEEEDPTTNPELTLLWSSIGNSERQGMKTGALTLTDGDLEIQNGTIAFSDGSVIDPTSGDTVIDGIRFYEFVDTVEWSDGASAPDVFTSLGQFHHSEAITVKASVSGCGNGMGVEFLVVPKYLGGNPNPEMVSVYLLGTGADGFPISGHNRYTWWVQAISPDSFRLGISHNGGCTSDPGGTRNKTIRYRVIGSNFDPDNTNSSLEDYTQISVQRFLTVDSSGESTVAAVDAQQITVDSIQHGVPNEYNGDFTSYGESFFYNFFNLYRDGHNIFNTEELMMSDQNGNMSLAWDERDLFGDWTSHGNFNLEENLLLTDGSTWGQIEVGTTITETEFEAIPDHPMIFTTRANSGGEFPFRHVGNYGTLIIKGRQNTGNGGIAFLVGDGTDYVNAMVVERETGYVGIGTTNPSVPLEVAGDTIVSGNTSIGGDTTISGDTTIEGTLTISNPAGDIPMFSAN